MAYISTDIVILVTKRTIFNQILENVSFENALFFLKEKKNCDLKTLKK